jgi:hypothetical protein
VGKLLGRTIFRADRVAVCAKNLEKDITAALRDGAFFFGAKKKVNFSVCGPGVESLNTRFLAVWRVK